MLGPPSGWRPEPPPPPRRRSCGPLHPPNLTGVLDSTWRDGEPMVGCGRNLWANEDRVRPDTRYSGVSEIFTLHSGSSATDGECLYGLPPLPPLNAHTHTHTPPVRASRSHGHHQCGELMYRGSGPGAAEVCGRTNAGRYHLAGTTLRGLLVEPGDDDTPHASVAPHPPPRVRQIRWLGARCNTKGRVWRDARVPGTRRG